MKQLRYLCWLTVIVPLVGLWGLAVWLQAQDVQPEPRPYVVYEKLGENDWHWWIKDKHGQAVAESVQKFPNKGTAFDDWQRLRAIAARDPDELVIAEGGTRFVPIRTSRNSNPPTP